MKPLKRMSADELTTALEVLETARPLDTALRMALWLELVHRATAVGESSGDGRPPEAVEVR